MSVREVAAEPPKVGRLGIGDLPPPPRAYDLRPTLGFESITLATTWDGRNTGAVRRQAARQPDQARALLALADRIDPEVTDEPETMASQRWMRKKRNNTIAAVWQLTDVIDPIRFARPVTDANPTASTFTVVGENWGVPLGQLHAFNPIRFMLNFRGDLNAVIAKLGGKPEGIMLACLHGAYDPTTGRFNIHIHGLATGALGALIDGLRAMRKYKPAEPYDGRDAANTPIVRSRQPLTNMPYPLHYHLLPRWWPLRETFIDVEGRRKAYSGSRRAIPDVALTECLVFLDRCRISNVTMLMGAQVICNRLVAR